MEGDHPRDRRPQPVGDQSVYLQVTRGVARRDHAFPTDVAPTVFAMSNEFVHVPRGGPHAWHCRRDAADERWLHCDVKSTSLLGNVLARQMAVDAGAAECVMFRNGFMTEGSASNIWVVRNGRVLGAPRDHLVLEGIRVGLMQELCAACGLPLEFRNITREEVLAADELLSTSATKEVLPITTIDGRPVDTGVPGPIYDRLYAAYQEAKSA
jgi:D-alanine transaminase